MDEPKKKLAEMSDVERRAYNVLAKRKSREKEKQARLAAMIPNARDYVLPETEVADILEFTRDTENAIRAELPELTEQDTLQITGLCSVLRGLEKNYTRNVTNPSGVLVGGYFPEAVGAGLVEHVHRYPGVLESPLFKKLYDTLLREILRWSKRNRASVTPELIADIQSEISGSYTLPPAPQILKAPEPAPPEPTSPSFTQAVEQSQIRMLERLQGNLSPEAQSYLNGN
jgi:hypothetical protein